MHPGLHRLLDLIRVNPQDSLLVDRFLILAADLEEGTRVDATLGLSEALLRKNPRRAIELAHMVYKARPGESQPIELMVEGLENLGRYGKATVLRAELEKVRKARETNPGIAVEVTQASVMTIDKELKFLAGVEVPSTPPTLDQDQAIEQRDDIAQIEPAVKKIKFDPSSRSDEATIQLNEMKVQPEILSFGQALSPEQTSTTDPDAVPESLSDKSFEMNATHHSQLQVKPESSPRPISQMAPGIPFFRELVPDIDAIADENQNADPEPEEHFANKTSISHEKSVVKQVLHTPTEEQLLSQVRKSIEKEQWDAAWDLIESNWPLADNLNVINLFRELNLARVDFRYMGWWLDSLVFDRRPRYALSLAINLLREQPHMALARLTIARIQKILRLLGFCEIQWKESEGVLVLLNKLNLAKLQTPAAVGIFRPRRAS